MFKYLKYLSNLSAVSLILTIAYFLNKGIDLSDEGYYLLSYLHPEESNELVRPFYYFFSDFVGLFNNEIVLIRGLNLILTVIGSLVFSSGILLWIGNKVEDTSTKMFVHSFILIGSCLSFSVFPTSLSYNNFLQHLILLIFGSTLVYLKSKSINSFLIILMGFLVSLTLFVKFTFTFVFTPLLITFILLTDNRGVSKAKNLSMFSIGFLTAFIFFFVFSATSINNPIVYFQTTLQLLTIYPDHGVKSILLQYIRDFGHLIYYSFLTIPTFTFLLIVLIIVKAKIPNYDRKIVLNILFIASSVWFLYQAYLDHWHQSGIGFMYSASRPFFLLLTMFFFAKVMFAIEEKSNELKSEIIFLIFLFIIPFVASAGTNGYVTVQILQYMPFWFGAIVLLSIDSLIHKNHSMNFVSSVLVIMVMLFSVSQIVSGMIYHPYRIAQPLTQNNYEIQGFNKSKWLRVDSQTKVFIETISKELLHNTNFKKGNPIIVMYDLPGLVYFLDGTPVGTTWYSRSSSAYNCYCLDNTKIKDLSKTVIIIEDSKIIDQKFVSCLNIKKIGFPLGYKKVLTLNHLLNQEETVSVYAPINLLK